MSGIISFMQMIIIILRCIYYSLDFIYYTEPWSYFYNRIVEDAGFYPVNSSSFFHFISLSKDNDSLFDYDFDFLSFRIIGIDTYYANYL